MDRTSKRRIASVLLACGPLWTCGGSRPPPAAAPSPPSAAQPADYGYKSEMVQVTPSQEGAEAATPESESAPPRPAEAHERSEAARRPSTRALRQATVEWERARAALDAAASDCALACRALASMERALVHLCALATLPDDRPRCEEARRRLLDARERVRRACGSCPGGPSVDPNAPVPSTGSGPPPGSAGAQ